ncbi:hypothetical protein ACLKA7_003831 [Drosophila subpalustris]
MAMALQKRALNEWIKAQIVEWKLLSFFFLSSSRMSSSPRQFPCLLSAVVATVAHYLRFYAVQGQHLWGKVDRCMFYVCMMEAKKRALASNYATKRHIHKAPKAAAQRSTKKIDDDEAVQQQLGGKEQAACNNKEPLQAPEKVSENLNFCALLNLTSGQGHKGTFDPLKLHVYVPEVILKLQSNDFFLY